MKKSIVNIIILLPLILVIFFVYKYGITVPVLDQWELVPLLEKMHNHSLTATDLWAQHNEHRIIFPQIVMLFLARLSNWNIFVELYTNILLSTFIFLFILSILRNTSEVISPWLKIFVSMMIFSMAQYGNWFWGWQIQMFMSVLGSVIAIWAANKWQGKAIGLIVVILAGILSSYSFNSGLLTWPAVLFVFLLQKKWKLKHIIILVLACIVTVLLYYYNYTKPVNHPPVLFFMSNPLIYTRYVLTYLGASLSRNYYLCPAVTIISLLLISLAIFNLRQFDRQKLCDLAPWLGLALYSCMAACMTGVGRAGMGWQQALASRYATISLFLPLSAGVLFWHVIRFNAEINQKKRMKGLFLIVIMLMFMISYINNYRSSIQDMKTTSTFYSTLTARCLTQPQVVDDDTMKIIYPDPNLLRLRIKTLSELGIKFKTVEYKPESP
jgi:hypothetical protein